MMLHFIRHGKTEANEKRLYCGGTDLSLCENGVDELVALKEQLVYPKGDLYIVSGLLRTIQTANILFDTPALIEIKAFREFNFGIFEMQTHENLKASQAYQKWISQIETFTPAGGESKLEFNKRVVSGFFKVKNICASAMICNAVIITHGGVISSIMEFLFPKQRNFYEWQPVCGRGYTLNFEEAHKINFKNI